MFAAKNCRFGDKCKFSHSIPPSSSLVAVPAPPKAGTPSKAEGDKPCRSWDSHGKCKFGDKCKFKHAVGADGKPKSEPSATGASSGSSPLCRLWVENACTYGDRCKFKHDGPGSCITKGLIAALPAKNAQDDLWTLDTGTGRDIAGRGVKGKSLDKQSPAVRIATAGGGCGPC